MSQNQPLELLTQVQRRKDREAHQKPLEFGLIRRVWKYTRPYARKRNFLFFIVTARSIVNPLTLWMAAYVLNGPILRHDMVGVVWGVLGYLAFVTVAEVITHFRQRLAQELGEAVVHDLRNEVFEHLHTLTMSFYDKTSLGRIISRITSDIDNVRHGVQDVAFVSVVGGGRMVVSGTLMLWYDWRLFLLVAAIGPILYAINRYFRTRMSKAHREVQESFSRVTATLAESVSGIRVTQGFVRQDVNARMFGNLVADHAEFNMEVSRVTGRFLPLLEFNQQFFIALLLLVGGYGILGSGIDHAAQTTALANLIFFLFLANEFLGPIPPLGQMYMQALNSMAGAERVFQLLDTKPQFVDPPTAVEADIRGRVEFRDVTFGYDPQKPVLFDVNFTADVGKTIALVGHTGSGKTSIINLISKFYLPTAGQILIDGRDIGQIRSDSLHRQMGVVLQVNYLFTGSVMENIRVGRPDATDAQVIEAARTLGCLDLLESLPDGLQTLVGERGSGLSLGQRQLVCFTRAMLANPRIMILDEATSSVDTMTEARVQKALAVLLRGRTSFVVAHRLSTIRHADLVLVLDHGRIVERGTHRQLLATGGVYANLYRKFIRASEA